MTDVKALVKEAIDDVRAKRVSDAKYAIERLISDIVRNQETIQSATKQIVKCRAGLKEIELIELNDKDVLG